jgi:hypothetical protein
MTDAESAADSLASYTVALKAMRLRLVVSGDVLPLPDEPIDLMTLRAIGGAGEVMLTLKGIRYARENGNV